MLKRPQVRNLSHYHEINFPLVYTQTATVAVYGYFLFAVIGEMYYAHDYDLKIPFLIIFWFIFNVGWLKVAQEIAKPFGTDDHDVDLEHWLDRQVRFVFTTVDYTMNKFPSEASWKKDATTASEVLSLFPGTFNKSKIATKDRILEKIKEILKLKVVTRL